MALLRPLVQKSARSTHLSDLGASWEIVARLGKIQPDATVWSEPFWVGAEEGQKLDLVARVYGDNIPSVLEVPIRILIDVAEGWLNADEDEDVPTRTRDGSASK